MHAGCGDGVCWTERAQGEKLAWPRDTVSNQYLEAICSLPALQQHTGVCARALHVGCGAVHSTRLPRDYISAKTLAARATAGRPFVELHDVVVVEWHGSSVASALLLITMPCAQQSCPAQPTDTIDYLRGRKRHLKQLDTCEELHGTRLDAR